MLCSAVIYLIYIWIFCSYFRVQILNMYRKLLVKYLYKRQIINSIYKVPLLHIQLYKEDRKCGIIQPKAIFDLRSLTIISRFVYLILKSLRKAFWPSTTSELMLRNADGAVEEENDEDVASA